VTPEPIERAAPKPSVGKVLAFPTPPNHRPGWQEYQRQREALSVYLVDVRAELRAQARDRCGAEPRRETPYIRPPSDPTTWPRGRSNRR
jgi:hypothetical protein